MKRALISILILLTLIACGSGQKTASESSSSVLDEGLAAVKKGDYKSAYLKFGDFARQNPADIRGPINIANALALEGKYDSAMARFHEAGKLNANDPRIARGVSLCALLRHDRPLAVGREAGAGDLAKILDAYAKFTAALAKRDAKGIAANARLRSLLHGAGLLPVTDEELTRALDAYLGIVTSTTMRAYTAALKPGRVVSDGTVARIELASTDGSVKDAAYCRKFGGKWQVSIFTRSLIEAGGN
ncbi:MAG: hypothetical protein MUD12_15125 [Spirochaetes bacterium]|jgi:tetratricopeptide (TPR) repeat protein|nr:hypothetical protein [Spirochaetota bacterium]